MPQLSSQRKTSLFFSRHFEIRCFDLLSNCRFHAVLVSAAFILHNNKKLGAKHCCYCRFVGTLKNLKSCLDRKHWTSRRVFEWTTNRQKDIWANNDWVRVCEVVIVPARTPIARSTFASMGLFISRLVEALSGFSQGSPSRILMLGLDNAGG